MKCPFCHHLETQVIETREAEEGTSVRRRRQCMSVACEKRFTTYERCEIHYPAVVKRDGRRVEYKRSKLLSSFRLALRKRPVSTASIELAVLCIEEKLLQQCGKSNQKELQSIQLGDWVMEQLQLLDTVAYIRFASVYQSIEDTVQFKKLVDKAQNTMP